VSELAEVVVLTRHDAVNDSVPGVRCYGLLPSQDTSLRLSVQWQVFVNTVRRLRGCDVIHSLIEPFGPGAALASARSGAAFVVTCHGTHAVPRRGYSPKAFVKRQLMKLMFKRAVITTTGSARTRELVGKVVNLRECRIIPNGVDIATFHPCDAETPKDPFVLTVGDLKPRKGVDVTVRALALLERDLPNLRYKVVGNTAVRPSFFEHVRTLARDLDVESRVDFLGKVSDEQLRMLYNQCSVFVLAAQTRGDAFEGFPMVYFEANACGAPVITTTGFGSDYAVRPGYNGFLVEPDNVEALADAMRKILTDPVLREAMGRNALKVASEHTWERIAGVQLMKMYCDAVNRQAGGAADRGSSRARSRDRLQRKAETGP
jgi:glycosyltransferase involved in cell wall biosynthesis